MMVNSKLPNWCVAFDYVWDGSVYQTRMHILHEIADLIVPDFDSVDAFTAPVCVVEEDKQEICDCMVMKIYEHSDRFRIYAVDSPWFMDLIKAVLMKEGIDTVPHRSDKALRCIDIGWDETYWQDDNGGPIPEIYR